MALINCPECGKETSNLAVSCPHCGIPIINVSVGEGGIRRTETKINKDNRIGSALAVLVGTLFAVYGFSAGNVLIGVLAVALYSIAALALFIPRQIGKCPYCGCERRFGFVPPHDIYTQTCDDCHKTIKIYPDHFETIAEETISKNENNS